MTFVYILITAIPGSVVAVSVAALVLLVKEERIKRFVPHLISYAVGTLLGASSLRMVPRALADLPGRAVMGPLLAGLIIFGGNLTIAFLTGGPK